jgi:plastocyanin
MRGRMLLAAVIASVAAAAAPSRPVSAERQTRRIAMKDVAFVPTQVKAHAGDTLEWDNGDIVAHTATSEEAGFDVEVTPGRKGSAVVTRPGTFTYTCRYHPNMAGQIVVKP